MNDVDHPRHRFQASVAVFLGIFVAAGTGCGNSSVRPNGKVLLEQQPVAGAEILFQSLDEAGTMFQGISLEDGSYVVDYGGERGMPIGKYRVTITCFLDRDGKPVQPDEEGQMLKSSGRAIAQDYSTEKQIEADSLDLVLDEATKEPPRRSS